MEEIREHIRARIARTGPETLYGRWATGLLDDPEVLALLTETPEEQYFNLLMAIVHYLLLKGETHRLARYYSTVTANPLPPDHAYPVFHDFCLTHADTIRALANSRWVQVNVVGRCTTLLPVLTLISRRLSGEPFAFLEIGSSAGLMLIWDRYGYDYGFRQINATASALVLTARVDGKYRPPLPAQMPSVAARIGMDIHPIDLDDPDAVVWLDATWRPDRLDGLTERLRVQQRQAIDRVRRHRPPIVAGDGRFDVSRVAAQLPADIPLVILDAYIPEFVNAAALAQSRELARWRPVYHITIDKLQRLYLVDYQTNSGERVRLLRSDPVGSVLEWLDAATADGAL
ncbi:MAG: DUF2332 domain-containing protein [Chloroflexi bacterium]|nr:DUF2332 domain-containing protein [Chloroflexota bacterium]